jgi:iron complex transport system substrate-binding protein
VRIASLVPSATEMLFALGRGDQVVAVTHECDYPPEAKTKPHLTRSLVPTYSAATNTAAGPTAGEIDAAVRRLTGEGRHLYELDEPRLRELDVDLIVTQAVCEVCAVSYDDVVAVAAGLPSRPRVISLDPSNLAEVLADVPRLGEAAGVPERAARLRDQLQRRLEDVHAAVAGASRPRVLALEWLDPPFIGGHWVPEMIEIAGGEDVLGVAAAKSRTAEWDELAASRPDVVLAMPCGWDARQARAEVDVHEADVAALGAERIWAVDAAASFSRPGPRLVDGTELLAHLLHPDRVDAPEGVDARALRGEAEERPVRWLSVAVPAPAGRSQEGERWA